MSLDVAVVGAGAAGLATAIFAARRLSGARVVVLDGATRIGAKVLISGGGRCNVTNREVRAEDYCGGSRRAISAVLRAFPASRAVSFFEEIGVRLHEEERGKLFPDSNRSRTILDALLGECARLGVQVRAASRVTELTPADGGWRVRVGDETLNASRAVLATGGLSLARTGSDGGGLAMAAALGHTIVPTTPALVPLLLEGDFHRGLAGVSHDVVLRVEASQSESGAGGTLARVRGPLLWTHFGISGPAPLDASRHYLRTILDGARAVVRLSFVPDLDFAAVERALLGDRDPLDPRLGSSPATVRGILGRWLPASVGDALLASLCIASSTRLAHLARDDRRRLAHALTGCELPVAGSRGYDYAEATAGGVSLDEIDRATMESTKRHGLYLVGEMLDVDGRLGGFNFQWAWSSAWVAGQALGRS